jgi:hypothetical protein
LIGQLEPHRPSGLLLPNGRAIHRVAARRNVIDADSEQIATAQLAVERPG